ncbi:flagellar hook-length control protein FliK [Enterobacter bugandensis]|uniref:flagellar hook-length control protein FliK n=1 Tax=Enterobacter bugandensis TaxID=881260 RepID=UPI0005F261D2|nr:flagellar hook-length control protein FliK [Enterobacter bugandensis]EKS6929447.1 flagellar hook-length control protein FliK [Enterobacter bugandensis]EKV5173839.1 flagellar hook-length control protein FliK [Enterobacter bugandensis]KJQ41570.1 flagellar hook-length control protein [Enterobacter bugandensis]MCE2006895.1 flagellar hook-length control protein FliK [Enterobacter bugandensis]
MNIDIAALLLGGGAQGKPKAGLLSDEDFGPALEGKLAQLFTGLEPQPLPEAMLPAGMLPEQLTEVTEGNDEEMADTLLMALPGLAEALTGVTITEVEGEESPQWQLQQLITRSVTGAETAAKPEPDKPAVGEKPDAQGGKTLIPLSVTEKSPAMTTTPLTAQSAPVASETVATPEMSSTAPVSAVALPAAVRTSVAPAPQRVVTVNHPPETPEWKQSVSQHIAIFSRNGLHSAEIRLHPEELGSLQISLRVQQDQAHIHIVSEHSHIRHAMEQAMPQLRAAMAESGIQLGQANVSAEGQQYAAAGEQRDNTPGEPQAQLEGEGQPDDDDSVPTLLTTTPGNIYGINTFA